MQKFVILGGVAVVFAVILLYYYMSTQGSASVLKTTPGPVPVSSSGVPFACYNSTPGASNYGILGRDANNNVQCLTPDGTNCYWYPSQAACQTALTGFGTPPTGTPLVCNSPAYIAAWGAPSATSGVWCASRTDF